LIDAGVSAALHGNLPQQLINATRQPTKIFFMSFRESFHSMFDFRRKASIADFPIKDKFERAAAAQIPGAFLAAGMLGKSPRYVCRDTCIETAIRTAKQVNTPGRHDRLMFA